MDKNELIHILEDWNFWHNDLNTGVRRSAYLKALRRILPSEQVKIITGARRSGKSYIMRQLNKDLIKRGVKKENILIINFEDPRFVGLDTKLLDQTFDTYQEFVSPDNREKYVFLDEIQEVAGWEKWVRAKQELKEANLVISGSNARLLSRELATVLTGRHLDMTVMPLSFKEFLKFKNLKTGSVSKLASQEMEIKKQLRNFLEYGAFPMVVLEEEKKKILLAYFDDVVNKDLVRRYRVRKTEKLKSLVKFYLSNIASPVTFSSSGKYLKMSADTVEKFSGYLETSYLTFFLKRFSYKVREQEKSPRKVYAIDTGLSNTAGFQFSGNLGRLAENAVFLELKRKTYFNPDLEIYYWKNKRQEEVDFVVKEGNEAKELIQVCWDMGDLNVRKRETKGLLKAMKEFKLDRGTVITNDFEGEEKLNGGKVKYMTLWSWLLGLDSSAGGE